MIVWRSDTEALLQLGHRFTVEAGVIRRIPGYLPLPDDGSALSYLILVWNYTYEGPQRERYARAPKLQSETAENETPR